MAKLEKAIIEIMAGSQSGTQISGTVQSHRVFDRPRQRLQGDRRPGPQQPAVAVRKWRIRYTFDGAVPRRLYRSRGLPVRHRRRASRYACGPAADRQFPACSATGSFRLGQAYLRRRHRQARPEDRDVPARRHAGARDRNRLVQRISLVTDAAPRTAPGISRQEQASPARFGPTHSGCRIPRIRRPSALAQDRRRDRPR